MTPVPEQHGEPHALVPVPDRTPAPLANLAARTLASLKTSDSEHALPRRLVVSADGSAMYRTIGDALLVAVNGDEILVRPGEYRESLVIDKSVTIRGDGPRDRIVVRPLTEHEPCVLIERGEPHLLALTIESTETDAYGDREGDWLPPFDAPSSEPGEFNDDEDDRALLLALAQLESHEFEGGDDDWLADLIGPGALAQLRIVAGSPTVDGVDIRGAGGLAISGHGTLAIIRNCRISDSGWGIHVSEGAAPRIVQNEVWGNAEAAIRVEGAGTDPLVRGNRLHDGRKVGIDIDGGARPHVEDNEVQGMIDDGIRVSGAGTDPVILFNRVHDGQGSGITVGMCASPRIEDNEIWGMTHAGIGIHGTETGSAFFALILDRIADGRSGTDPLVRANRIHDGQGVGIFIAMGASPRIEDNEIWGNAHAGIGIVDAGTDPLILGNRVHDGETDGIDVSKGAAPRIEGNEVWGNAQIGISIHGAGTKPLILANRVHDGQGFGIGVRNDAEPRIEGNEVWANAGTGLAIVGAGTIPLVRANTISNGSGCGIWVAKGASPQVEGNDIWGNAEPGILVEMEGTNPSIRANRVHDGQTVGIRVSTGASPLIEENEIWGNAVHGLYVSGTNTSPVITGNTVRDGLGHGIHVRDGATPTIHGNTFTGYSIFAIEVDDDSHPIIGSNDSAG